MHSPYNPAPSARRGEWGSGALADDSNPNRLEGKAPVKPCRSFGGIDRRAQVEIVRGRRSDTPTLVALADVSEADWRKCGSCGGGADRRALRKLHHAPSIELTR